MTALNASITVQSDRVKGGGKYGRPKARMTVERGSSFTESQEAIKDFMHGNIELSMIQGVRGNIPTVIDALCMHKAINKFDSVVICQGRQCLLVVHAAENAKVTGYSMYVDMEMMKHSLRLLDNIRDREFKRGIFWMPIGMIIGWAALKYTMG